MHKPAVALGLWNAPCRLTVTGGVAGRVWQSVQASYWAFKGFCGLDA